MKFRNRPLVLATREILFGYRTYKRIKLKYGKGTHIFLIRGKTGDIYLYFRFLNAYIQKNGIDKYIFVGDGKGIKSLLKLYPNLKAPFIPVSVETGCALQKLYCFLGADCLNMTLSLMWDEALPYNRCTIRMTDRFNFIDSYYWFLLDLDRFQVLPTKARFRALDNQLKRDLRNSGVVAGRTVIISPYSYCISPPVLPLFWILLAKDLEMRGYKVFAMLEPNTEGNGFGLKEILFSYADSAAVLEYAGHFIGLRSGFCDIISETKCNKVILYPTKQKEFDRTYLRADIDFCSLKCMELSQNVGEFTMPSARVGGDIRPQTENLYLRTKEDIEFINKVLEQFPPIKGGIETRKWD